MMLDDIATYLEAHGFGTVGVNLFKGSMPPASDDCIAVYEYAGSPPDLAHDGAEIEQPGLQIRVRNKKFSDGSSLVESIKNILHPTSNKTIGKSFYLSIMANHYPIHLGTDQNNRHEWTVNFSVKKAR